MTTAASWDAAGVGGNVQHPGCWPQLGADGDKPHKSAPNMCPVRFFKGLINVADSGQVSTKCLSARWGQISATCARLSSCRNSSAEWLKGLLF